MARIDWVVLAERGFLDEHDRLCVLGVTTQLAVPQLPIALNQLMLVARLADLRLVEELAITVALMSPRNVWVTPDDDQGVQIEMAREYILITFRGLPLTEEGIYTFRLGVSDLPEVAVRVPVLVARTETAHAHMH